MQMIQRTALPEMVREDFEAKPLEGFAFAGIKRLKQRFLHYPHRRQRARKCTFPCRRHTHELDAAVRLRGQAREPASRFEAIDHPADSRTIVADQRAQACLVDAWPLCDCRER